MADMKQKLNDLGTLLKSDRKTQVIAVCCLGAVLFLMFYDNGKKGRQYAQAPQPQTIGTARMDLDGAYTDLLQRFREEITTLQEQTKVTNESLTTIQSDMENYQQRTAKIFTKIIERLAEVEAGASEGGVAAAPPPIAYEDGYVPGQAVGEAEVSAEASRAAGAAVPAVDPGEFEEVFKSEIEEPVRKGKVVEDKRIAVIGPGDSVRVKLLTGVNAPTDGRPYPVVFRLASGVHGPDGSLLPLGEARLVAAAQGSIADQRALFRLTTLNIRFPTGEHKTVQVDGWIVGEDGIRGMPGILIDPFPKVLIGLGIAGVIGGVGQGLSSANSTSVVNSNGGITSAVNGNTGEFALGRGVSESTDLLEDYIREKAREFSPLIKVLSDREGTAIFSRSLTIDGLYDALEDEELVYASVD